MKTKNGLLCDNCFEHQEKVPCFFCGYKKETYHPDVGVLPVGTILKERYHIGKVLGKGGFGVTYKAYDKIENIVVAIKEYYPNGMAHRDTGTTQVSINDKSQKDNFQTGAEKFYTEAKTISRFNGNPNIVGVRDFFYENGTAYFAMEYLDGMDLKHYIQMCGGKLTQENVVHIARVISDALVITHSMNVLHRDISPDNIYILDSGEIKLIDFGAARQVMSQESKSLSVILKHGFAPLEQYQRKGKQGAWTDIYALGATLYYALTGKIPDDATERIDEPELGNAKDYGVDAELWKIINKCMAVKIADRYSGVIDLKTDLNKLGIKEKELERTSILTKEYQKQTDSGDSTVSMGKTDIPDSDATVAMDMAENKFVDETVAMDWEKADRKKKKEEKRQEAEAKKQEKKEKKCRKKEAKVEMTDIPEKKWSKRKKSSCGILVLILFLVMRGCLRSESVIVERLGTSNSNVLNDGGIHMIENQYMYFMDGNKNLCVCTYDAEDDTFYVDSNVGIIKEDASYISLGQDKVYFVYGSNDEEDEYEDYICQMNFDGTEVNTLSVNAEDSIYLLQYAQMTNGKEYLYYLYENTTDEWNGVTAYDVKSGIARYDIETEEISNICEFDDTSLMWFNLYKDSVYYTKIEENNTVLYRSNLDGTDTEAIVNEGNPTYGFVENEVIYLYSLDEEALIKYDLDGTKIGGLYNANMDTTCYTMAYVNDWIYYISKDDMAIHKIRSNDTGDVTLTAEVYAMSICNSDNSLWIAEAVPEENTIKYGKTYLTSLDCSNLIPVGGETIYQTESGLQYWLSEEGAVICGCVSERIDVGIPDTIDGYEVCGIEEEKMPEGYNYFRYAKEEDLAYKIEDGEVTVNGYNGELTKLMIPETIEGCPVVTVDFWYGKSQNMQAVALPEGVKEIAKEAFAKCSDLIYIGLPESLETICEKAFKECKSLKEIRLPNGITGVGNDAFLYSGLERIYISAGASGINGRALYGSSLKCTAFEVEEGSIHYKAVDGVLYSADGKTLVAWPMGKQEEHYTIVPGTTVIDVCAFAGCGLKSIKLADTVTEIKGGAMMYSDNLTKIVIPQSVKKISNKVFFECKNLTQITVSRDCVISEDIGKELTVNYYE